MMTEVPMLYPNFLFIKSILYQTILNSMPIEGDQYFYNKQQFRELVKPRQIKHFASASNALKYLIQSFTSYSFFIPIVLTVSQQICSLHSTEQLRPEMLRLRLHLKLWLQSPKQTTFSDISQQSLLTATKSLPLITRICT